MIVLGHQNPDCDSLCSAIGLAALFNKIGKWDQDSFWMYYEDVDLCRKVKLQDKEIALLRNVELKHSHSGSSRRNPETTAITKSEVVASSHVYIQLHLS